MKLDVICEAAQRQANGNKHKAKIIMMKDIKELRTELRMLKLEQQWLKAKTLELKNHATSTRERISLLRAEIQKQKAVSDS